MQYIRPQPTKQYAVSNPDTGVTGLVDNEDYKKEMALYESAYRSSEQIVVARFI